MLSIWTNLSIHLLHVVNSNGCNTIFSRYITVIILGRAISANLSPMAHVYITYGPKWPVKILDGAKFNPDCAEIKNRIFQFLIQQACREKLSGINIYTRTVLSKLDSKVYMAKLQFYA